ncbi:MAG: FAD-dependent oxidoreductase [Enhydrobacter sp.]|nr:MAG: FAD-dependent oxidoreductase [Enhydrobacter sp.]
MIVIGAGPAGLSAATALARAGLRCLALDKLAPGGALINLGELHDTAEAGTGADVAARLTDEAMSAGAEIGFGEVSGISGNGPWTIETTDGEHHVAKAIVVATGLNKGRLGLPEEESFEGRGLSHCAACDGPLYAGQPVIVAGREGWAAQEARELEAVAGRVTVLDPASDRIVALEGDDGLQSVVVESGGARKSIPARAVFVYVGQSPAAEFLPDSLARDASGHIVVDETGRASSPTAFAAGDVRAGSRSMLVEALADGRRAAEAIVAALKRD